MAKSLERVREWEGGVYVIRDVWDNGTHEYTKGARLVRCYEGVLYAEIQPLVRLDG